MLAESEGGLARPVLEAAEAAAGAGDLEAAERLLREALALQESSLGPSHADLANTLNNLAVVCERMEKFDEAEQGYRRAHAIAVASLAPRHPFVATSLKNLVDFCVARGIPLWAPPTATPVLDAAPPVPVGVGPAVSVPPEARPEATAGMRLGTPRIAVAALAVSSLVALMYIAPWQGAGDPTDGSPEARSTVQSQSPAPSLTTPSPAPASPGDVRPSASPPRESNRRESSAPVRRDPPASAPAALATVTVLTAQVCSALDRRGSPDWACTPVTGAGQPGVFTFYTRLLSGSDTTVEHRWYYGDRLHQTMRLNVRGSQDGYRTYSRNTVTPGRTGEWKVELRAPDGSLLQEEHFVIR